MKNRSISCLIVLLLVFTCSCAGPINRAIIRGSTEKDLLKAGFKSIPVTEEQETTLKGLPPGKITSFQRHGTIYYAYPDLKNDRLLIGKQEAYTRYNQIVTHRLTPITRPSGQLDRDWVSSGVWDN